MSSNPLKEVIAEHPSNPTKALYENVGSMVDDIPEVDVLLVGAGFASLTITNR
jgi:ribulose 1,5-bisphosphate synthetase/thiazole synthase